jgi:type IV pilus assembly protein PilO
MRLGLRELIFFIVLLTVPVGSFFYVFKPRNDQISEARKEIQVKQARLDSLAAVEAKIDDIGLAIEEGRDSIQLIEAKLPSEQDVQGLLQGVSQTAKRNKLNVKSFKSEKILPAALYMEQPIKVQMSGEFDGFYQFLLELENLPRITRIHQLKLERANGKGGPKDEDLPPGSMKAEFTLSIYFQPQAQQQAQQDSQAAHAATDK